MRLEVLLLLVSVFLLVSILASELLRKLGIPALVVFLGIGMLAGSDGPGGIYFDDAWLAQTIGVIALAFILFAGGLDTDWHVVRPAVMSALSLATLGVLLTALLVGVFAAFLLQIPLLEGLLLGAIISSTDAAAVFAILRNRNLRLRGRLAPLLELESGCNDPMAVFLTIGLTSLLLDPHGSPLTLLLLFVQQMGLGAIGGLLIGKGAIWCISHLHLDVEGLYPVLTLALVLLTYGLTNFLGGSGFLAVYVLGLLLGNSALHRIGPLTRFHDGIAWLMQITMFLTLGLLVFPSRLPATAGSGIVIALVLLFLARPASVLIALLFARFSLREKLFVGWVGLRGAVPIVLATFPLLAGLPSASFFFDLVFFIVLVSVLLQGPSLPFVASLLGVAISPPVEGADQIPDRHDVTPSEEEST